MDLLKMIVHLVFVLQLVLPIAVSNLVVFGNEISCEVSEATNSSCTRTVDSCIKKHEGELQQCFGEAATEVPSNCPAVADQPIGNDCPNYRDPDGVVGDTGVVPESVNLTAYPIYPGLLYGLRVTWSPSSDFAYDTTLQGYQVKLTYKGDRTPTAGCVCKNYTETEHNFTLHYIDVDQLTVTVRSYPGNSDANKFVVQNFSTPKNCYDLPYDPIHCGPPRYSKPSNLKVHSTLTSNGTVSAKISWGPPQFDAKYPTPSTYYLSLIQRRNRWEIEHIGTFIVSNAEVVTIHSLNMTDNLQIQVQAYVKCSGYDGGSDGFNGCGVASLVSIPSPTSTALSSVTASVISAFTMSTVTTVNSSHGSSQWNRNKLSAVVGGAVGFVVVATVIIAGLFVMHHKRHRTDPQDPDDDGRLLPDPEPSRNWEPHPPPSPDVILPQIDSKMVFLLHSPKSPIVEVNVILERIYKPLRQYIAVTIPGDYTRGLNPAEWLSNRMCRASVVLCVCNATFKSEWNGIRQPSVEVNTLKQLVSGAIYCHSGESSLSSKYATVCLKQSDYHCIPALLSGTSRFLMDEIDKMVAFTTETPRYAAKS